MKRLLFVIALLGASTLTHAQKYLEIMNKTYCDVKVSIHGSTDPCGSLTNHWIHVIIVPARTGWGSPNICLSVAALGFPGDHFYKAEVEDFCNGYSCCTQAGVCTPVATVGNIGCEPSTANYDYKICSPCYSDAAPCAEAHWWTMASPTCGTPPPDTYSLEIY